MRTLVHLHTCTCPPAPLLLLPFPHHCFGYTIWLYNLGSICCSLCRYYSLLSPVQSSFLIYVLVFLCNYCHCVIIAFFFLKIIQQQYQIHVIFFVLSFFSLPSFHSAFDIYPILFIFVGLNLFYSLLL